MMQLNNYQPPPVQNMMVGASPMNTETKKKEKSGGGFWSKVFGAKEKEKDKENYTTNKTKQYMKVYENTIFL